MKLRAMGGKRDSPLREVEKEKRKPNCRGRSRARPEWPSSVPTEGVSLNQNAAVEVGVSMNCCPVQKEHPALVSNLRRPGIFPPNACAESKGRRMNLGVQGSGGV